MQGDETFFAHRINENISVMQDMVSDNALLAQMAHAGHILVECFQRRGRLLVCGNGGSAADAQHIATEFVSRFQLERPPMSAEALTTNTSSLTAIGNDYGFEIVFARQVEAQGRKGDVLMGLSTSGNSRNVVIAMEKARTLGIATIGMSGSRQHSELEAVSDCFIAVPSAHTPRIQEGHILIGHMLCEYAEAAIYGGG